MVVFDMAGTTINEDNLVYKTVLRTLQNFDCPAHLPIVLAIAAGKEKREAIRDTYQEVLGVAPKTELLDQMHQYFKDQLDLAYDKHDLSLFEGVAGVLEELKTRGIIRVFNTGYTERIARKILQKVGVEEGRDIDLLVTADMVSNSRPAPDMIQLAMDKWKIEAQEVIKIGDSKVDIEEGKNAGVRYSMGITTGAQKREVLAEAQPDYVVATIDQVLNFIG